MSDHRTIVDMPKEELHDSVKQLLETVEYLKRVTGSLIKIGGSLAIGFVSVVTSVLLWFFGQVNTLKEVDKAYEIKIHDHGEKLARYDRDWERLNTTLHELDRTQRDMMLQASDMKSTLSAASVNVQNLVQRVDGIVRILQNPSRKSDVLDNLSPRQLNGYDPN